MKSLPKSPSLEFLKREAKALYTLHSQDDATCCDQIRKYDTSLKSKIDAEILSKKLSIIDAQRIVAREYGYSSWATLKNYIESLNLPDYQGVANKQNYHKTIVDSYDKRSKDYDNFESARVNARQTVDYCLPEVGNAVLDIASGTGTLAFYAASLVGPQGSVTGIDISKGMLKRCNEKLKESDLCNLRFLYADAENMDFPPNSFDRIYCSSAFFWMSHPLAALRHWFELIKPGGELGFNAWPDNSFIWGDGARRSLRKYGVNFTIHEVTGNMEKIRKLVKLAGFTNIRLYEVKDGRYVDVDNAKGMLLTEDSYAPGQDPHPLTNVPKDVLLLAQEEFEAEVDKRATEKGVWHDMTMYYVYGQKL